MNYTLLALRCDACGAEFAVYTEMSNHHLAHHEAPLHGAPVDAHPVRWGPPPGRCEVCAQACEPCVCCEELVLPASLPPPPVTVLAALQAQCHYARVPWDAAQARALLEALGVPADANADSWRSALQEAMGKLRASQAMPLSASPSAQSALQRLQAYWRPDDPPWDTPRARQMLQALWLEPNGPLGGDVAWIDEAYARLTGKSPQAMPYSETEEAAHETP